MDRLPENRKEAFFYCYREHWRALLRLHVRTLLSFLPMLLVLFLKESKLMSLYLAMEEPAPDMVSALYRQMDTLYLLPEAVALTLYAVVAAGSARVLRQILWQDMASLGYEFGSGIRQNGPGFLGVSLFVLLYGFASQWVSAPLLSGLLNVFFWLAVLPVGIWMLLQTLYYRLKFKNKLLNSVIFAIRTLPATLGLLALTVLPFWLGFRFLPLLLVKYIVLPVLALIWVIPGRMLWMLYGSKLFDEWINKNFHPDFYRKGLL